MELNKYEEEFVKIYGMDYFIELYEFIKENDIMEYYNKSRSTPMDLLNFGFHYGIISIVAFCYCQLKLSLEIHEVVNGYFKSINSTTPEFIEIGEGREMSIICVPIVHSPGSKDGIVFATIDKFTTMRQKCMNYLLKMIRFSKVNMKKDGKKLKYIYTIVDKYIQDYQLLDVC
jgi:hypothetical protein